MFGLVNLISSQISAVDFSRPFAYIDVALAAFLIVTCLVYLRHFPIFRVLLGVVFLFACSVFFLWLGLIYTALVFGVAANIVIITLPLIFAPEIRHYLEKLGRFSFLKLPALTSKQKSKVSLRNLLDGIYDMASKKVGGTIVIARRTGLGETIDTGIKLDARFSPKLFETIFFPNSPLHDGAVVISGDRIVAAKCLLPISGEVKLDLPFGTRHRSGVAITRDTDAIAIIVSEQRGEVSLAENGRLHVDLTKPQMADRLQKLLSNTEE